MRRLVVRFVGVVVGGEGPSSARSERASGGVC